MLGIEPERVGHPSTDGVDTQRGRVQDTHDTPRKRQHASRMNIVAKDLLDEVVDPFRRHLWARRAARSLWSSSRGGLILLGDRCYSRGREAAFWGNELGHILSVGLSTKIRTENEGISQVGGG
jgi:hypothetical protein